MAERRMFAKTIIDSDAFLDMPLSSQALYFHLSMRADDDGFINNPKKIQRMIGCGDDDLKLLMAKRFILVFESSVIVIKHWRMHNYIRADRYKPTIYQDEMSQLEVKDNKGYTMNVLPEPKKQDKTEDEQLGIPDGNRVSYQPETQVRLGKDRLGKDNKDTMSGKPDYMPAIKEIIDYLNKKTNSNYRPSTKATQTKIKARLAEGFNVDDFKRVIDIKCAEWLNDANMSQYLRPETLFGTKFESYSQQKGPAAKKQITQSYQGYQRPQKTEVLTDWESLAQSAQRTPEEQAALDAELEHQLQEFYKEEPK